MFGWIPPDFRQVKNNIAGSGERRVAPWPIIPPFPRMRFSRKLPRQLDNSKIEFPDPFAQPMEDRFPEEELRLPGGQWFLEKTRFQLEDGTEIDPAVLLKYPFFRQVPPSAAAHRRGKIDQERFSSPVNNNVPVVNIPMGDPSPVDIPNDPFQIEKQAGRDLPRLES